MLSELAADRGVHVLILTLLGMVAFCAVIDSIFQALGPK